MKTYRWNHKGFTLAEMAVVVLLIGIAMAMGLKMVTSTLQNSANSETKSKQERIRIALVSHLRTHERLPCPDSKATPDGNESATCNANATQGYGVVPWLTLGLSKNDVLDGWGNYFTYKVANRRPAAVAKDWTTTPATTTRSFNVGELTHPSNALTIQELNAAGNALVNTSTQAVVVILSHGKNGFGAETTKGTNMPNPPAANLGEITNNTANTAIFVKRPYTDSTTVFNGPFDDLVDYMTPKDLLQPLLNDGSKAETAESETKAKQEKIKATLIGYLRTNKTLPCPDRNTPPDGNENATCNANATQGYGVIPWLELGLSKNDVLDGWGNYFTYRMANRRPAAVMKDWTTTDTATSFNIGELSNPSTALTIQELNTAGTALINASTQAVAIILSHGKNGFGAINASGANMANPPAANTGEQTNNTASTPTFVKRPYTESATAFNGPFDDLVEYMTPQDLLQPLINDGTWQKTAESDTITKQEQIKTALTGYLRTHGYLPCPNSRNPWDGAEDRPNPTAGAGADPATTCLNNNGRGVIPWQALGLARDAVRDGWGNFFTYRVVNLNNNTPIPFTPPPNPIPPLYQKRNRNWTIKGGTGAFDIDSLSDATKSPGYQSLRIESGGGTVESRTAVAVILSHGKNGLGARTITGTQNTLPPAGTDERTNSTTGTTTFIHRPVTNDPLATGGLYDDFITYMNPQDLLQPLVNEKTIWKCKSYCPAGTCPAGGTCTPTSIIPIGAPNPTCTCTPSEPLP